MEARMYDYDRSLTRNEKKKPPFPKPWAGRVYWRHYDKLLAREKETAAARAKRLARRVALQHRQRRPCMKQSRLEMLWEHHQRRLRVAQCKKRERDELGRFS
jgi:hypothetical protein